MQPSGTIIRLYSGAAPGSEQWTQQERQQFSEGMQSQIVSNVTDPTLTVVAPDPAQANGTAIIICPGGGFHLLVIDFEGMEVAHWLAAKGITCFVLKYRLVETKTDDPLAEFFAKIGPDFSNAVAEVNKLAHADGVAAVAHVRQHAAAYGINPNRTGIMGFSAGGAVAASVAMTYTPASRPDFVAPIYLTYDLVIQNGVPADAPPLFALAATDDEFGFAAGSVRIYSDWLAAGKSAELHLYSTGGHGFGMKTKNLPSDRWIELFAGWLGVQGLLQK
jgi:acetyl esterase/lipase